MRDAESGASLLKRGLLVFAACALAILCLLVLRPFLAPLLWAAILTYVTWPLYRRLRLPLKKHDGAAASLMTLLVVIVALIPVAFLVALIQHELLDAYRSLTAYLSQGPVQCLLSSETSPGWEPGCRMRLTATERIRPR
jgi:predicted PurR-regulated permease PerM